MMRGEVELKPSTIIAALEKRIAELEERVAALEKKKPAPAARKVTKEFVDRMVEKYADAPITVEGRDSGGPESQDLTHLAQRRARGPDLAQPRREMGD